MGDARETSSKSSTQQPHFSNGLLAQYGVVGLEQLAALYPRSVEFRQLADRIFADLAATDEGAG